MVGLGGAGKTRYVQMDSDFWCEKNKKWKAFYGLWFSFGSLVRALTSEYYQSEGTQGEKITDGIDITTWNVKRNDENIVFSVWDFAGQTVYYNTHQVT